MSFHTQNPTPRPQIRVVRQNQSPSEEMRKWLLSGRNSSKNKNIVF